MDMDSGVGLTVGAREGAGVGAMGGRGQRGEIGITVVE